MRYVVVTRVAGKPETSIEIGQAPGKGEAYEVALDEAQRLADGMEWSAITKGEAMENNYSVALAAGVIVALTENYEVLVYSLLGW